MTPDDCHRPDLGECTGGCVWWKSPGCAWSDHGHNYDGGGVLDNHLTTVVNYSSDTEYLEPPEQECYD